MSTQRGVTAGNDWSEPQAKAIEMLADGALCKDVAEAVNVNVSTISKWKRNPQFIDAVVSAAKDNLRAELPSMYKAAANKAKAGNHNHLRIILDHLDRLEEMSKQSSEKSITFKWEVHGDNDSVPTPTTSD